MNIYVFMYSTVYNGNSTTIFIVILTKYRHFFFYSVLDILSVLPSDTFTRIRSCCYTGNGAIVLFPYFQWRHTAGYWWKSKKHDDVIQWKHLPRYWFFVRGIQRSPGNSPHKGQLRGSWMFSLINKQLSKQSRRRWFVTSSCSLRRHCNDLEGAM